MTDALAMWEKEVMERKARLVTIRRENMRRAKLAERHAAEREASKLPRTFNGIKGLDKLRGA